MIRLRTAAAWFATLAFVASGVAAPDDAKIIFPGASAPASATAAGGGLGNVTLLVGVALAALGTWLVWRARQNAPVGRDLRALSIQETRSLGNRQFLVVASYDDKKFLLGVCPGQINFLAPLDDSSSSGKKSS
jgi:flagellar protein FliO/FliZ